MLHSIAAGPTPTRAEQVRRYEEAAANQQAEIGRQEALARRTGCGNNSFFVLFSGEPAQCGPMNAKIQQMRGNLESMQSELARMQDGGNPERDGQRRNILVALAQNNCGQQYNAAIAAAPQPRGGLFESLFGPGTVSTPPGANAPGWSMPSGSYRTVCVRTCDGYYYPISYAASPARFAEDEKLCQKSCPAAEVMLFAHRNPGEDMSQAVSTSGQLYSALPNAYKYRQAFDSACSCRAPGESWAKTLKGIDDSTVERGDIVVNDQRARQLSQPRVDAQGKPIAVAPRTPVKLEPKARCADGTAAHRPRSMPQRAMSRPKPDPNRPVQPSDFLPGR